MKILLWLSLLIICFTSAVCGKQSELPRELPKDVRITVFTGGGMSRSFRRIEIQNETLKFEESNGNPNDKESWTKNITHEDLSKLYQVFVENKFDVIKNDERKEIVYDAPNQSISLIYDAAKSVSVNYGANKPLSGNNLTRYKNVQQAILDLVEKYRQSQTKDLSDENRQVFKYGDVKNLWELQNTKPAVLTDEDLAAINEIFPKAINDYNEKITGKYGKLTDLSKYKRQLVPYLNAKGEKEVWVNCFCSDFGQDWRKEIIQVDDGGRCFFNLRINLMTKKGFDLRVNGQG